ncbi:sialidase family protein [Amycolatopsis sp. 195334CR]|uniref:sialidase family protein n=1 Tax=Amycolatopsis sp. 195334CR TaxID=2814588 RepID=UPI001A90BAEF|nr:sialidase family protein [Amycolatopsis sp. 195334CR]MBN6037107.1 exo-alpha-sialidase [Amycolatopsis sp. 195334CR]
MKPLGAKKNRPGLLTELTLLPALIMGSLVATPANTASAVAEVASTPVYQERSEGYDCFRIPAVVRAGNGDLLAFAEGRNGGAKFCADAGDIDLVYKRSTDGGKSWGPLKVVIEGFGDTKGNPVPIAVPGTGRIVLLSTYECVKAPDCGRKPRVSISDDNGHNWSVPREITQELGFSAPPPWLATGPSHGIVLARGEHEGRLVAGLNYSIGSAHSGALIYSDDQGATWKRGAVDTPAAGLKPQEISPIELADGRVYAAARNDWNSSGDRCANQGKDNRAFAISFDGGGSFSKKFAFEPDLITPPVQGSTQRLRATDDGSLYNRVLFAAPSTCDRRKELRVRSSYDEGANWQTPGVLVWGQDAAYSDMVQLDGRNTGLLFEAGPEMNANASIRWAVLSEASLGLPDGSTAGLPVTPDAAGANHAYLRGGPAFGTGRLGKALTLDGKDDYVQLPFAEALATGGGDFTWSGWFNYGASTASQSLLWAYNQGEGFSQVWLRAEPGSNRLRAHLENGPTGSITVDAPGALNDQKWHHFALTRSGGTASLYVDGKLAGSASGLTGSVSPGRPFAIHLGQRLDGQYRLQGSLDEIRLYGRSLTAAEISALATGSGPDSGLRLRLPLDATR